MSGIFSLFRGWFLLTLLLFTLGEGAYLYHRYAEVHKHGKVMRESDTLRHSIEASDYEDLLSSGHDLPANDFVNKLPYPSIRVKAEELREKYNRRAQMIRIIDVRKREFSQRKLITREVVMRVNQNLQEEKKKNLAVRNHYLKIVDFAEMCEAEALISKNAAMLQARVDELEKENEQLLQALDTPPEF